VGPPEWGHNDDPRRPLLGVEAARPTGFNEGLTVWLLFNRAAGGLSIPLTALPTAWLLKASAADLIQRDKD
jgi:hypothetical protein